MNPLSGQNHIVQSSLEPLSPKTKALLGKHVIHLLVGAASTPLTALRGAAKLAGVLLNVPYTCFKAIANEIELQKKPEEFKKAAHISYRFKEASGAFIQENIKTALIGFAMLIPVAGLSLSETLQLKTASLANIFESSPLASITSGKFSIIDQVFNAKGRSSGRLYNNITTLTSPIEEHKIDGVLLGIAAPDIAAIKKQLLI